MTQPSHVDVPGLPGLREQTLGHPSVVVAIVDGRIDTGHPSLAGAHVRVGESGAPVGAVVDDIIVATGPDGSIVDETIDVLDAEGHLLLEDETVSVYDADAQLVSQEETIAIALESGDEG